MSSERRRPGRESSDKESSYEDESVLYFVPALGIDIEVLVFYLKSFLGLGSDAQPGGHPEVRSSCANSFSVMTTNRTVTYVVIS
jgi:hypothetical protein